MFESTYRRRLEKDIPDWEKSGWVTPEGAAAILMSAGATPSKARLPIIIGFLGAIVKRKLGVIDGAAILGAGALPLVFAVLANSNPGVVDALWVEVVSAAIAIGICVWAMNYGPEHHYPTAVNLGLFWRSGTRFCTSTLQPSARC